VVEIRLTARIFNPAVQWGSIGNNDKNTAIFPEFEL